jgi:hypothetical protein
MPGHRYERAGKTACIMLSAGRGGRLGGARIPKPYFRFAGQAAATPRQDVAPMTGTERGIGARRQPDAQVGDRT